MRRMHRRSPLPLCSSVAVLSLLFLAFGCARRETAREYTVDDARAFFASQPRYLRPIPHTEVPEGLTDLRAETCGMCHDEIYEEWRISTHARAWEDDPQFMEEMAKTTAQPGRDASWLCANCHTPLEEQLPRLVAALEDGDRGRPIYVDNPHFDETLQLEAITCATCHVRDGVILGPYGAEGAPHPVRQSDELFSVGLCTQCHQVEATLDDVEMICTFDTGETFAAGPWAAEGKTCQACHMPEVERAITNQGTPVRKTRRHWFGGSLIPKKPEFEAELAPLRDIYPDGARIEWVDLPKSVRAGTRATVTFTVTNAEAGHSLPTADVERYLLVSAQALDPSGAVLAERVERFGTRYEWHPKARKLDDTRLAPRETRAFELEFEVPAGGKVSLRLEGTNHRISPENFAYHQLEGRAIASRVFHSSVRELPTR